MAGRGNAYTRQMNDLQQVLEKKLQQLSLLEQEQRRLVVKEKALQEAIHGFEGPLVVTKGNLQTRVTASGGRMPSTSGDGGATCSGSDVSTSEDSRLSAQHPQSAARQTSSAGHSLSPGGANSSSCSTAVTPPEVLLDQFNVQEDRVQQLLQQLGGYDAGSFQQLYTTQVMQRALSNPEHVASRLSMTVHDRCQYVSQTFSRLALLLGRYDSSCDVRRQFDAVVDDFVEGVVSTCLWDKPANQLSALSINLETRQHEPYPAEWWQHVAKAVNLTKEQQRGVKLMWDRVNAQLQQLARDYDHLSQQLQAVKRRHLQQHRTFHSRIQKALEADTIARARYQKQQQQEKQQEQHSPTPQQQQLEPYTVAQLPVQTSRQACFTAQQQQEQQVVASALQGLLDSWQHDGFQDDARAVQLDAATVSGCGLAAATQAEAEADKLAEWLMAELQQVQQLELPLQQLRQRQQQQQQLCQQQPQHPQQLVQQPMGHKQQQQPNAHQAAKQVPAMPPSEQEAIEVLLQEDQEELHLERLKQSCVHMMKALYGCQIFQLTNTLSKKQIGIMCVHSYPYACDPIAILKAHDEIGWDV